MAEKILDINGRKYTLRWGWGVINRVRTMMLDGIDRTKINEMLRKKQLTAGKQGTKITIDDLYSANIDLVALMKSQHDVQRKVLKLMIAKSPFGELTDDKIDYELNPEDGDKLYQEIQKVIAEQQALSMELKKK